LRLVEGTHLKLNSPMGWGGVPAPRSERDSSGRAAVSAALERIARRREAPARPNPSFK
jgi:hypothetical protein